VLAAAATVIAAKRFTAAALENYSAGQSPEINDRTGALLFVRPNSQEYYAQYLQTVPNRVKELLIAKEDRAFYWHAGINPPAIAKNIAFHFGIGNRAGSSTITQQLAKNRVFVGRAQLFAQGAGICHHLHAGISHG